MITPKDARVMWECIPAVHKEPMTRLKRSGRWNEARPAVLAAAQAELETLGAGKVGHFEVCWALIAAARRWLEANEPPGNAKTAQGSSHPQAVNSNRSTQ